MAQNLHPVRWTHEEHSEWCVGLITQRVEACSSYDGAAHITGMRHYDGTCPVDGALLGMLEIMCQVGFEFRGR